MRLGWPLGKGGYVIMNDDTRLEISQRGKAGFIKFRFCIPESFSYYLDIRRASPKGLG